MTNRPFQLDVGAYLKDSELFPPLSLTTADNGSTKSGIAIDRLAAPLFPNVALSCKVNVIVGNAVVRKAAVQTYTWKLQTAVTTAGTWTDLADHSGNINHTFTIGSTAAAATQTAQHGNGAGSFRLASSPEFLRCIIVPTIGVSTGTAAKANVGACLVFGGNFKYPPF